MNTTKKKLFKVISLLIFAILLFVTLAYLSEYILLPMLPKPWQTDLVWLGSAIFGTIVILSGLAQFTGYSLKDIFSSTEELPQSHQNQDSQNILNVGTHGKIGQIGDILQGNSTKIVIDSADMINNQKGGKVVDVENLIRDVQSALYDDNSRLPYVLALALDLCDQTGLSEEYGKWLKMELSGYRNYEHYDDFQDEFDNEEQFEAWMDRWAKHRLIEPFVKVRYNSIEQRRFVVDTLPLSKIFLAIPVPEIARKIQAARDNGAEEFHLPLRDLGQDGFAAIEKYAASLSPGFKIPPDLPAFYTVSDLENILNGTRDIVLSLLSAARQRIA